MKIRIICHTLPHEIDFLYWQAQQLKMSSVYLDDSAKITFDVTLNMNLVDWNNSKMSFDFFVDKFEEIKKISDWTYLNDFDINTDGSCMGINDKRRNSIRKCNDEYVIYLDNDVIFNTETLAYLINAAKNIKNKYFIVSPQTVNLWDNSWDIITNQKYIGLEKNFESYSKTDSYSVAMTNHGDISIDKIEQFKFGGGWFNLISTNILKLCDIPDSLGPYGLDDYYVMVCCGIMKQRGFDISQYILNNVIVSENLKYKDVSYKKYLNLIDRQSEYRSNSHKSISTELNKFSSFIKVDKNQNLL